MEQRDKKYIGRITTTLLIIAATLGIAMAGGLVQWQEITSFFKGDDTAKETASKPASKTEASATYAHTTAFSGMPFALSVEGCSVSGEAGSLSEAAELTLTALDSVPPMAAGMVNVTRGAAGYRLSPSGMGFSKPVRVELGYDSLLLPKGHSAKEVRTFLYDTDNRRWEALPMDSVMEGAQKTGAQTTKAGELVNAIVQLPEAQSFTPSMLSKLEAAHPASGVTLMEPPAANSQGTANLSYPIAVPTGRNGLQPNLSVSYSSEAGNGLLGMGWDMQLPAITVDSKWGVPRYDGTYETECYSYNGQELLPSPHHLSQWELRSGNGMKVFRPRTEGAFDSIVRYGDSPKNYWWVVTDKGGTKYYYGSYSGYAAAATADALLKDSTGNIASWPLCRVEDMDGNSMSYYYSIRNQSENGVCLGKQLWLESIRYTDNRQAGEEGKYTLFFGSGNCPQSVSGGGMRQPEDSDGSGDGEDRGDRSETASGENGNGGGEGGENGDPGSGNCNCDLNIKVVKTDSCTGDPIEGVGFDLVCDDGSTGKLTDAGGEAGWSLNNSCGKTYTLSETWAHPGYRGKQVSLTFMVDNNCNIIPLSDVGIDRIEFGNYPDPDMTVYVSNKPECSATVRLHKRNARTGRALDNAVFDLVHEQGNRSDTTGSSGEIVWQLDEPCSEYMVSETRAPYGYRFRNATAMISTSEQCLLSVTDTTGIDSFRIVGGSELHLYVGNMPYNVNPFHPKADSIENAVMGPRPQQPSGFYSCMHECDCDDGYPYDLRTDARLGFLRSSKEKLRRIMVFYKDSLVRSYSFCYGSDIFGRAQLRSIRQYGADCDEEPYTHTFSYYEETDMVRLKNESHAVNNAERGDNDVNASMISRVVRIVVRSTRDMVSAETAIGGSLNLSASAGGGADIGMGVDACTKENSIGYSGSYSSSSGKGLATLADINGDGLPDRVYLRKRQVCYKLQIAGANSFGTERKLGVSSFLSDNSTTSHHGPAANIGPAHGGMGWNSTTSRTSAYFTDVNGDGMMDLVRDGMARSIQPAHAPYGISCQNGCGLPSVTPGRDSAAHISLENVPSVALSGHSDMPSYDLVRVWTAGYSIAEGGYSITAPVKVLKDTIAGVIPTRDTIEVYVEFYGRLYGTGSRTLNFTVASCRLLPGDSAWAGNLLARTSELTDTAKKYVRNGLMGIDNGGLLFFRVRSKGGRPVSHVVEWDPQVVRSGSFNSADGLPAPNAGKASACQLLESSGKLHCPFEGVLRLRDTLHPTAMRDTVRYRMRRNNSDFRHYPYTYRPGLDSTGLVDDTLHVHRNDSLEFTVEVRSNVDLAANQWHPHLYYLSVTDSNTNGEVDNVSMIIPGTPDNTTDSVLLMELHPVPKYDYYRQYLDCSPNCNPMVTAGIHNVSFNINGTVIQDSLRLVAKTADGVLSARTYYHNSYKDDLGNYPFAIWNIARDTMVYMECYVGRETRQAYVGANIKNAPCAVFSCCAEPPHPLFGGMYGGWGQFQYLNDGQDKIDTTVINAFADSVAAFSQATLDRYAFLNDTNFLKRVSEPGSTQAADTLAAILGRFRCLPLTANGETRRYEGADPNSYICGKRICLGNVVTPEPAVTEKDSLFQLPGTYVGNGTVAGSTLCAGSTSSPASAMVFSDLDRISESSSTGYTCGALMFGGSYSNGGTETTNDLTDLNGDGCPDFIRPGGQVYYSLPRLSRWETEAKPALPSDGPHTSSNRTVGGNFTAQVAQTVKKSSNRGDGQNVIINRSVSKNTKAGVNANTSTDKVEHALVDINGDGLPDLVYRNGFVRLGTGYGFTSPWKWNGIEHIGIYLSEAGGNEASKGANKESWEALEGEESAKDAINNKGSLKSAWKASISGGVSYALSLNQHQVTLTDMNGDGLPDLVFKSYKDTAITGFCGRLLGGHIWYRLNNGSGFDTTWIRWSTHGENQVWGTSATVGANIDGTGGMAFPLVKFSGSANANASLTTSGERIQIADFDGDGLPDLLKSKNGRDLDVRYAHLGRTGLLKTVTNPLGGSVTMDYEMTEASVYHSRRWVMTKVMTNDSLPGDGCDMQRTHIGYAHGWYDRTERDFLGFAVVVVNAVDGNNDTLRTTIQYYDNRSFYAKGSLLCEALVKISETDGIKDTTKYIITTYSYDTSHIPFVVAGNTYRSVFPKLTRRQTCFFEGLPQAQVTAWEEYDYENTFGNVTKRRQGSTDQPAVEANISYHAQYNNNRCVNKIASVEITGYRKRTTEVDNKGHYTAFRDWYDNTHYLATRLQYDQYGNVTTMRGPNTTVHYTYDNYVHTYPTAITDTFGVTSQMQDYDFRFGIPRTIVDQAGSRMEYTLDEWGRTATIRGPKEIAAGKPFTIRHTYTGREPAPAGSTRQRAVSMAMTENYDPEHPQNPIRTYTYCDGLGRIVQTRKEAEIGGVEKLVVSGHTVVDALGRTVETYYPTEKSLTDVLFAFDPDQSASASTVTYDILDRPLVQTAPDASTTTFSYGFAYNNDLNKMLFSSTTTDANSHVSTELKDVEGKPWAVQASGQPFVYFNYNPVGDNTKVYSAVANDWERNYTYDMLGRRLTYQEGELVESLTYNGSNLASHTQNWMENGITQNKTTQYHYNAHRLDSLCYDDALTTIYHYDQYGRVDSLYDESGVVCYTYGNMGEIIKETRIYALPFLSQPIALKTEFRYDSWGRVDSIYYPDGERLNYQYDLGGQLKSITNNSNYTYLDNVTYDRFGAKVSQEYGNGLVTSYTYDSYTRRLSQITVADNSNNPYGDIQYGYDPVGNVTQANSTCPWLPNHTFSETFTYDASDQLTAAAEMQSQSYSLSVAYGNWGKISSYGLTQRDMQHNTTQSEAQAYSYPVSGSLGDCQTLFAPEQRTITDANNNVATETLAFGINGSLRKREVQAQASYTEYYLFNSAANMKAYSNNGLDFAYYGYNASNTRTYKLSMLNMHQWVNGQPEPLHLQLQSAMFYPNAYINFNQNGEYTKHYYNGTERIASRLGDAQPESFVISSNDRLGFRIMQADQQARADLLELVEAGDVPIETPSVEITSLHPTNATSNIFYYHTNHLGSTAYVTDNNATITQGFLYAPFGEITTEYAPLWQNGTLPKYSFNAKELDEETGMYYYEARYYKPPVFTSRDPMFEKYFWMTPYAYCANNPLKYVDPDGRSSYRVDESGNIFLVKRNNKDYDRVYATNSKGKIDKSNYVQIGKEVLNSKTTIKDVKCTYSDGETITTDIDIYTTPNNESATNFFQFVAKNSKVEWSHVHGCENGTKDINYIGTGHMDDGDPSQNYITSKYMGVNVTVERADHSHPNNSSTVSQGDVNVATKIQNRFPNAIFNIYLPKSNRYESYDKNSMPGLLEEVIVKPKN